MLGLKPKSNQSGGSIKAAERQLAELAAILAHEVAHVKAKHMAEKLSLDRFPELLKFVYGALVLTGIVPADMLVFVGGSAATSMLFTLPYSRLHETEADLCGLDIMVEACVEPEAAIRVWEEMLMTEMRERRAASGAMGQGTELNGVGDAMVSLLSTHPPSNERIEALQEALPYIRERYSSKCSKVKHVWSESLKDLQQVEKLQRQGKVDRGGAVEAIIPVRYDKEPAA
jgi:predicted Zn-dependent protease